MIAELSEQGRREARYWDLLALAADDSPHWEGFVGPKLVGWSGSTRGELRLTSDREQKQLFGRVLVPHDARHEELPGDHDVVEVPAERSVDGQPLTSAGQAPELPATSESTRAYRENPHETAIMRKLQLDVLGTLPGGGVKVFSIYHRRTEEIRDIGKLSLENLLRIAGPHVKEYVFKSNESARNAPGGGYTFAEVREAIALLAGYQMIGDQTELGVGVWEGTADANGEPSVVLVGVGEGAYWNGDRKLHRVDHPRAKDQLLDFESGEQVWYDYRRLAELLEQVHTNPQFAIDTLNETVSLFQGWRWRHEHMAPLVTAGLVFSSFVQAIWNYRPQVAVIGPSNSGKSFLWGALERIFGSICIKSSKPTAAGIRQAIGCTSKVVILDEFEQEKNRAEILEMLRASSRGDKILRGTTNQKGQEFRLRHITWVAAIEVGLRREPDRNRFIMLELLKPAAERRGKLVLPPASDLATLGQKILAVAIHSIGRAKVLAELLKDTRVEGINDRVVESHAVPVAMLAAIHRMNDEEARGLLREVLGEVGKDEPETIADESSLMSDVLSAPVIFKGTRRSIGQLLDESIRGGATPSTQEEAEQLLETSGLRMLRLGESEWNPSGKYLAVAHRVVSDQLLKQTEWAGQSINQILRRIPGAKTSRQRIGGQNNRCVLIPYRYLEEELIGDEQTRAAAEQLGTAQKF